MTDLLKNGKNFIKKNPNQISRKKIEMKKNITNKLQEAQQRRKLLQDKKLTTKSIDQINYFKKHWMLKEEALTKNIELYQLHEEEKRNNIKVTEFLSIDLYHTLLID